jgi:hypothetical protein
LGIGIEETNAGIGIPVSRIIVGTGLKNAVLRRLSPEPDLFWHH